MDTTYCEKCGLLHDPQDGDCNGCKLVAENKELKEKLKKEINIDLDLTDLVEMTKAGHFHLCLIEDERVVSIKCKDGFRNRDDMLFEVESISDELYEY